MTSSLENKEKLKGILPAFFKKCNLDEIKVDCLVHLLGMSKEDIFDILKGQNSSNSSYSKSELPIDIKLVKDESVLNASDYKSDVDDDTLDITISKNEIDSLLDESNSQNQISKEIKMKNNLLESKSFYKNSCESLKNETISDKLRRYKYKVSQSTHSLKSDKKSKKLLEKKKKNILKLTKIENKNKGKHKNNNEHCNSTNGKGLLEILELEMRARAIRALLEKAPNAEDSDSITVQNKKLKIGNSSNLLVIENENDKEKHSSKKKSSKCSKKKKKSSKEKHKSTNKSVCVIDLTEVLKNVEDTKIKKLPKVKQPCEKSIIKSKKNANKRTTRKSNTEFQNLSSKKTLSKEQIEAVLKNNKICANLRKRVRHSQMLKQKKIYENQSKIFSNNVDVLNLVEEGSVEQLNLIKSLDRSKDVTYVPENLPSQLNLIDIATVNDINSNNNTSLKGDKSSMHVT